MCTNFVQKCSLVIFLACTLSNADKPTVETTHGVVEGRVLKTILNKVTYHGFLGIPYAAPPVNDLRFLPPQPLEPWDGVLLAKKEKKPCIQFNAHVLKGRPLGLNGVEDCLYLDIFTPKTNTALRPVIFFIYNFHFQNSYNKTRDYSPDFFIEEDVVIVMPEHRQSVTGFLSLEDEIVPGNAGLKDLVAALEWTKSNIDKFGGDPERITLMGSRGGAAAVDLLMHSKAKSLFSAAILQGQTSWLSAYLHEDVKERAFKLGELVDRGASSNSKLLKALNDIPVSKMLAKELQAAPVDYFKENQRGIITFSPIVEKQPNGLITEYPENCEEKIDIPIMVGFNSREGIEPALQYLEEPRYLSFVQKDFPFYIPIRVNFKFDPLKDICYDAVDEIKEFYYKDGRVTVQSVPEHITYLGDILATYPVDKTVQAYSKRTTNSIYYYHFDFDSELNEIKNDVLKVAVTEEGTWGAAGGDELCYLFYCPYSKKIYEKHQSNSTSAEMLLVKKMVKMWTNFAKYGNPIHEEEDSVLEGVEWPSYNLDEKKYLNIGHELEVKSDLFKERFEFWDNFINKWEKVAENGLITEQNNNNTKDEL